IGFIYIFNPTFEYLIKQIIKINKNSGVSEYKVTIDEDKSLDKLLDDNNSLLKNIFGEDFYYLLENLFFYKFGLNLRNTLLHGDGIEFIDKKYVNTLFYILIVLITYAKEIEDV
ncbi:MAG: DUF4209 domain-containing protein, partial [Campylobacterota bacterium]|nr:DUF4209 domain-containing protein [Campylobacterota bacterium]